MNVILLCGGAGLRFDCICPKPLNLVYGVPMIDHVLSNLNINDITILYNDVLDHYQFKEHVQNRFHEKKLTFVSIDYQTRGPVETLLVGLNNFMKTQGHNIKGPVLVLDNDNVYCGLDISRLPCSNFILYTDNSCKLSHYSFVDITCNGDVKQIKERQEISDKICIGGYGFEDTHTLMRYCKEVIMVSNEGCSYFSHVYNKMLDAGKQVHGVYLPEAFSLGSPQDIVINYHKISKPQLKVVFDLDNTLVTYPNKYRDYSTVAKIDKMVQFLKYLKSNGHYIIINTARNMLSTGGNEGKLMKNVGKITLDSLDQLGIPYDELYFGKPYGDIYIDDKAFNPFDVSMYANLGFFDFDSVDGNTNCWKTNKNNKITKVTKDHVKKEGTGLEGEIYYYTTIHKTPASNMFPRFLANESDKTRHSFIIEYINGTPLYKIYCEGLLQKDMFIKLLDTVCELHKTDVTSTKSPHITEQDMYHHYMDKFLKRAENIDDYPFEDFHVVKEEILHETLEFMSKKYPIGDIIHGDLWFSNIMLYKQNFKFFDMRGKLHDKVTLRGHTLYDWAKLYQSICGLDSIIQYGNPIEQDIKQPIEDTFWSYLVNKQIITSQDIPYIKNLTRYLIFNTFFAYEKDFPLERKNMIWLLIKNI